MEHLSSQYQVILILVLIFTIAQQMLHLWVIKLISLIQLQTVKFYPLQAKGSLHPVSLTICPYWLILISINIMSQFHRELAEQLAQGQVALTLTEHR